MTTKETLLAQLKLAVRTRQAVVDHATAEVHHAILEAVNGGCSLADIGAAMGIDRQTVRWHISKARQTQEQP